MVKDVNHLDTDMENLTPHQFDAAKGESPVSVMRKLLLKQPDAIVVPDIMNSQSMDALCHEVVNQDRTVVTQVQAKSAAEACRAPMQHKMAIPKLAHANFLLIRGVIGCLP